jgi:hypothetical protein
LGRAQLDLWAEAVRRALDFRRRLGEAAFADVAFARLQSDPVEAVADAYGQLGLPFDEGREAVEAWARSHPPGAHGLHEFSLEEFGLDEDGVRERFAFYLEQFPDAG